MHRTLSSQVHESRSNQISPQSLGHPTKINPVQDLLIHQQFASPNMRGEQTRLTHSRPRHARGGIRRIRKTNSSIVHADCHGSRGGGKAAAPWTERVALRTHPGARTRSENLCRLTGILPLSGLSNRRRQRLLFLVGILSPCWTHLTLPGPGIGAWLDSLSVRCLSSYLFFALILVTSTHALWRARWVMPVSRFSSSP